MFNIKCVENTLVSFLNNTDKKAVAKNIASFLGTLPESQRGNAFAVITGIKLPELRSKDDIVFVSESPNYGNEKIMGDIEVDLLAGVVTFELTFDLMLDKGFSTREGMLAHQKQFCDKKDVKAIERALRVRCWDKYSVTFDEWNSGVIKY